jgi:lactate racemase
VVLSRFAQFVDEVALSSNERKVEMVTLFRKSGNLDVKLPETWKVLQTIFREAQKGRNLGDLLDRAIDKPVDSRSLKAILKRGAKVAVVVDDLTRPTPAKELLPPLLKRIREAGIPKENIDIVIGVGTHRALTEEEIRARCGEEVAGTYRIQNHDARSPDLVKVGEIPGYGPVLMNATVARADVKITVGSILPHPHNGFGGGPKNVMPGICDFDTIRKHHLRNVVDPRSILGNIEGNPFYMNCCQIAELAAIDFSINCLYDSLGNIYEILAGNPFDVHSAGIRKTVDVLGIPVSERADITLVSSYPYDEGPQIVKPVLPAAMTTKPGGTILLVAEILAPLPELFLDSFTKIRECGGAEAEARIKEKLLCVEPIIEGPMDFNMALILIFFASRKFRVVLIADKILQEAAGRMGFEYASDLSVAIEKERWRRKTATVNLIPAGGYVFPMVKEEFRLIDE